ncbi:MAG: hypothetical protein QGH93_08820, partial [Gammaproteobacteria bacterium]|nr:hypothetical protein [Gammaproteobacteria bacterium]
GLAITVLTNRGHPLQKNVRRKFYVIKNWTSAIPVERQRMASFKNVLRGVFRKINFQWFQDTFDRYDKPEFVDQLRAILQAD